MDAHELWLGPVKLTVGWLDAAGAAVEDEDALADARSVQTLVGNSDPGLLSSSFTSSFTSTSRQWLEGLRIGLVAFAFLHLGVLHAFLPKSMVHVPPLVAERLHPMPTCASAHHRQDSSLPLDLAHASVFPNWQIFMNERRHLRQHWGVCFRIFLGGFLKRNQLLVQRLTTA